MRHKRIRFEHLQLNGISVEVRYGDLIVAKREESPDVDWEILVSTTDSLELDFAEYDLHMETSDARQIWGSGFVVRSDGRSHVFRGGGELDGISAAELDE